MANDELMRDGLAGDDLAGDESALLSIGEFAARTGLSAKALRIYDRNGLLRPHLVEDINGYRRYAPVQVPIGRFVRLLRDADLSLAAIESVISQLPEGSDGARQTLDDLLAEIEREHRARRFVIRYVQSVMRKETLPMFEISTRTVPARRLMSIQRRLHGDQTDVFAAEARAAFSSHLGDVEPTGPFTLIFHGPVNAQDDGPLEAVMGVPDDIQPSELIGIRVEEEHSEAYTTITKSQWDYPAILAAYDAVENSSFVGAKCESPLSCREVYLADPDEIGAEDPICDIAYPLAKTSAEEALPTA